MPSPTVRVMDPWSCLDDLDRRWPGELVGRHHMPARAATSCAFPPWCDPVVVGALLGGGISSLWSHQAECAQAAHEGRSVVISTGTASGKSLGYLLPALSDIVGAREARPPTTLYLAPTKALAADQRARIDGLALPGVRCATYDGDTPSDERRWIREHANIVLTNPDLIHHSLLPAHERWRRFLRALRYVVIDECHVYRGVLGTHVAAVLRRLRRVAALYGAAPVFVLASATSASPREHSSRLTGLPLAEIDSVTVDGSPRGEQLVGLWDPARGARPKSTLACAAGLMAELALKDVQTVTFARSRVGVEVVALCTHEVLSQAMASPEDLTAPRTPVAAYRGGYLPEERRLVERAVRDGSIRALAATNALELGVDITGLDAVVMAGWPGTRASFRQQSGRAGRTGQASLAVLVAADDPLDAYLVDHPDAIFDHAEALALNPANPHVLAPHLCAAAAEHPLTPEDERYFGEGLPTLADHLVSAGLLRRRPGGWYWTRSERPTDEISLRGSSTTVRIVESSTGRVVGTVDSARAPAAVHAGAVHLHQGTTYVVTHLDLDDGTAHVVAGDPGWTTSARSSSAFDIVSEAHGTLGEGISMHTGAVAVRSQVTSFLRRLPTGEVLGEHPLDLPEQVLPTTGVWWVLEDSLVMAAGVDTADLPGALHAAEHAAIGMLPLVATADRWDVGGVSTACHPDTGRPTIMVYDGFPGGAGIAEHGYTVARAWLTATRDTIDRCPCLGGCPACVQSPKCGNGNEPLSKTGAVALLTAMLEALP